MASFTPVTITGEVEDSDKLTLTSNPPNATRPIRVEPVTKLFADSKSYEQLELRLKYELVQNAETKVGKGKIFADFVPHYSGKHKVGFFSQDRSSQTELSDVVNIKEMTIVVNGLLKEIKDIKKDIIIAKQMMVADYKSSIQTKSLELYVRVNDRVAELETMHTDKVATIRRAYRQQLNDALISMQRLYKKKMENQVRRMHKLIKDGNGGSNELDDLKAQVTRSESVISMLQLQLEAARAQANRPPPIQEEISSSEDDEESGRLRIVIDELRDENVFLEDKMRTLSEELHAKDESIAELKNQLGRCRDASEKAQKDCEMMRGDLDLMTAATLKKDSARLDKEKKKWEMIIRAQVMKEMTTNIHVPEPKIMPKFATLPLIKPASSIELGGHVNKRDIARLLEAQRHEMEIAMQQKLKDIKDNGRKEEKRLRLENEQLKQDYEATVTKLEHEVKQSEALAAKKGKTDKKGKGKGRPRSGSVATPRSKPSTPQRSRSGSRSRAEDQSRDASPIAKKGEIPAEPPQETTETLLNETEVADKLNKRASSPRDTHVVFDDRDILLAEIERLRKELERVHKVWEKKFTVLQLSLHALKDESYIRLSMGRATAPLHRKPIDFHGGSKRKAFSGGKLPRAKYHSALDMAESRFSPPLHTDENQIMECQELPPDIMTLPPHPGDRGAVLETIASFPD